VRNDCSFSLYFPLIVQATDQSHLANSIDVSMTADASTATSLVHHTIVVRTESDTWLNDLVKELNTEVPSYINVINKGNVIDSLMFQGLLIEHMQSNILGIRLQGNYHHRFRK
jgi:hypothetical protein